jgi:hypothetical protein
MILGLEPLGALALGDVPDLAPGAPSGPPVCLMTVRLAWPDGEPVVGAAVSVTPVQDRFTGWIGLDVAASVTTGDTGEATATVPAAGLDFAYRVVAVFDGLDVLDVEVQAPEGAVYVSQVAQATGMH